MSENLEENLASGEQPNAAPQEKTETTNNEVQQEQKPAETLLNEADNKTADEKKESKPGDDANKKPGSLLDDKEDKAKEGEQKDWREKYSGDEKLSKWLGRFKNEEDMVRSAFEAQRKISSGVVKTPPGEDATPEEVAAWRIENGLPDKPEGYETELADGLIYGEEDKPIIDGFHDVAMSANLTIEQAKAVKEWYARERLNFNAAITQQSDKQLGETRTALQTEYGADYKAHINNLDTYLKTGASEAEKIIAKAISEDGLPLMNNPAIAKMLIENAHKYNPVSTITPGTGNSSPSGKDARIKEIEDLWSDPKKRDAYYKNEELQAEYRKLIS